MSEDRIYLRVSFDDKDKVKALGCRWDSQNKLWYCTQVMLGMYPELRKWLPPGDQQGWKAKAEAPPEVVISPGAEMLRRLIQLCHPDKHANSQAALLATQYLLDLKAKRKHHPGCTI